MSHPGDREQADFGLGLAVEIGVQLVVPADRVVDRKHRVRLAVIDDHLAGQLAELREFRIVGVGRRHEFHRRLRKGVGRGVDFRRVPVEIEREKRLHERVRRAGDWSRRGGEYVIERGCAHRRDDRIVVPGRDRAFDLPQPPVARADAAVDRPVGIEGLALRVLGARRSSS